MLVKMESFIARREENEMNTIKLSGEVVSLPVFSHEYYGEKFYAFTLESKRLSGVTDKLNCIASEKLIDSIREHTWIALEGEIRTRNHFDRERKKVDVDVFVMNIAPYSSDVNDVTMVGYICKQPTYRETPKGRHISDILIASNRENGKHSDYIPCIAWSRNAHEVVRMPVGTKVTIHGRFQSRMYLKQYEGMEPEVMTAYEVSISQIIKEEKNGEHSNGNNPVGEV